MKQVVIMPGGFHPFHAGHYALYQSALKAFPGADVYVAATNDTSERPFPFAIKEKLAQLAGVEPGHFVQVKSPFQALEITQKFNPKDTQLIFVRSEKDADKPPRPGGVKKNGEPAYLQPYNKNSTAPMSQHGYMAYLPTVEFGPGMTSATEIRAAWPKLNEKRKTALVMSLYPKTQTNPKLAATVVKMLDTAIGTVSEHHTIGYVQETPVDEAKKKSNYRDAEMVRAQQFAKMHYPTYDPDTAFDKFVQRSLAHAKHDDQEQNQILQSLAAKVDQLEAELQKIQNQPVDEARIHFTDPKTKVNLYYVPPKLQAQGRVQNVAHNIPYSTVQPLINRLIQKYPNLNPEYMVWYPLGQDRYGQRLGESADYIEEARKK